MSKKCEFDGCQQFVSMDQNICQKFVRQPMKLAQKYPELKSVCLACGHTYNCYPFGQHGLNNVPWPDNAFLLATLG